MYCCNAALNFCKKNVVDCNVVTNSDYRLTACWLLQYIFSLNKLKYVFGTQHNIKYTLDVFEKLRILYATTLYNNFNSYKNDNLYTQAQN